VLHNFRVVGRSTLSVPALSPLEAAREDLTRWSPGAEPEHFQLWLAAALCLWRTAQLPPESRAHAFERGADVVRRMQGAPAEDAGHGATPGPDDVAAARDRIASLLESAGMSLVDTERLNRVTDQFLEGAAYLEQRGGFGLAYSLLVSLRAALAPLPGGRQSVIVAQQGRIARQLGALGDADAHYRAAERLARVARDDDATARALIGRGVLAATKGNYPEARLGFRRALQAARRGGLHGHEAAANQGLLAAAVAAGDVDTALVHGWLAYRDAVNEPGRQAEILVSLAEIARLAGYSAAALAAYLRALQLTGLDRVRLPALGGAALAAAGAGRRDTLDTLARDAELVISRSHQPFEEAYTLLELAEAYAHIENVERVAHYLSRAKPLAEAGSFFELVVRADDLGERIRGPRHAEEREAPASARRGAGIGRPEGREPTARRRLGAQSRSIIGALEALPAIARGR
jgi:hypothetical protein